MEYYSTIKKNEMMPFSATWMALEIIILSEARQREKDKYYMLSFICEILKNDTNELICQTEIDSETQTTNIWLSQGKVGEGKG